MKRKIAESVLYAKIKEFLTSYLPVIKKRSPHTVDAYRDVLNLYLSYICNVKNRKMAEISLADFNQRDIIGFLGWLEKEKGNLPTTLNQRLAHIKGFCKFLMKKDVLAFIEYERISDISDYVDERIGDFEWLSIEDVKLILEQPDIRKKTGIRDRFFLALLYETGCRNDEILHIRMKDFTKMKNGDMSVHIFGKGNKHRCTPLSKDILPYFEEYCKQYHENYEEDTVTDDLLFYTIRKGIKTAMSQDNVQRFLKKYEKQARLTNPDLPHLHAHLWRRTRAMHLYRAGVPLPLVSEWLGHASEETTRVYYAKATEDMKRKAQQTAVEKGLSAFDKDVPFKYADDEEALKKLCGLK